MNNFVIQTLAIRFYLIVKIIKNIFFSYFNFLINQKTREKGRGDVWGKKCIKGLRSKYGKAGVGGSARTGVASR